MPVAKVSARLTPRVCPAAAASETLCVRDQELVSPHDSPKDSLLVSADECDSDRLCEAPWLVVSPDETPVSCDLLSDADTPTEWEVPEDDESEEEEVATVVVVFTRATEWPLFTPVLTLWLPAVLRL